MRGMAIAVLLLMGFAPAGISAAAEPGGEAPRGRDEKIHLPSAVMTREVRVRVWLPPRFDASSPGSVPLLVFLHDGFGSEKSFFRERFPEILEEMIARGEIPPVVVASPRTVGTFNTNDYRGRRRVVDFLTGDLVPGLLARYPQIRRDSAGHALTGISMGGYGALKIALRRPDLFGSVSSMSAWVDDLSFAYQEEHSWPMRFFMRRVFGPSAETSIARNESLFRIVAAEAPEPSRMPPLLLITGENDPWALNGLHGRLERSLAETGIAFEARRHPGAHKWEFWRRIFPEIVRFHAARMGG